MYVNLARFFSERLTRRRRNKTTAGDARGFDESSAHHANGLRTISKTLPASSVRACCWI